ncbi:MAG: hypothetical protein AMXMBFR12_02610 [Candidatus Babeliales bacterium]
MLQKNTILTLLSQKLTSAYHFAMDHIIAPPFCVYCKNFLKSRTIFCISCEQKIDQVVSVQIPITPSKNMMVMAACEYKEPVKSLIIAKSWGDIIAGDQLGHIIWDYSYLRHVPCDYLIPVPLHWLRTAKRGYNQAEEIAKTLAKLKQVHVASIVSRTRNTPFQSSVSHDQRHSNVKQAFALKNCDTTLYQNKHLIIVDDLMTTGSTLSQVAKVLIPLQPASISAIVACRVV